MSEGRIIAGRYRLQAKLGQGGMGSVYRAVHLEMGSTVAVKLLEPTMAESKVTVARFRREAQAAASIRSQHVVQILDFGIDGDCPYLVMEYLMGESLASRLSRQGALPPTFVAHVMGQVGKALERAHAIRIVHRDLKPDNIFLVRDGNEIIAKVLDFGIAKTETNSVFDGTIETQSGAILGTPHYMSPEQAAGRDTVDHRADIWSLGVIVFQCLTGFRPFNGSTVGGLVVAICSDPLPKPSERGSVPKGTDAWFAKAAARNKAERWSSVAEAVAALKVVCDSTECERAGSAIDGLSREATAIASQRGKSVSASGAPSQAPALRSSEAFTPNSIGAASVSSAPLPAEWAGGDTVSPAAHTVDGVRRRRSWLSWGLAVVAVACLLGAGVYARFTLMQERDALSTVTPGTIPKPPAPPQTGGGVTAQAAPVTASPVTASPAAAPAPTHAAQAALLEGSPTPRVGGASPPNVAKALGATAVGQASLPPRPKVVPVAPTDLGADSSKSVRPPSAQPGAIAPNPGPNEAANEPDSRSVTAKPAQRIEDRLAF